MKKSDFKNTKIVNGNIKINLSLERFDRQFEKAQFLLDSSVMTSMKPFMPHNTGNFIDRTSAQSASLAGSGVVVAAAPPYGRFLYEGKVMIDPETGSPWARKGAKKVVTDKNLKFSNPKATPHWFDAAKKNDLEKWVEVVRKEAGGK